MQIATYLCCIYALMLISAGDYAFNAVLLTDGMYQDDVVVFDAIKTNFGEAYSRSTGIFTAPGKYSSCSST